MPTTKESKEKKQFWSLVHLVAIVLSLFVTRQFGWPWIWAIALGAVATAFVWLVVSLPRRMVESSAGRNDLERVETENELRRTIVEAFGGLALLVGLIFTYAQLTEVQRTNRAAEKVSRTTLELTRDSQLGDQFGRAIQNLNDERLEMRIGGIYGLEWVASSSDRHHWPAMEVLTTFLRRWSALQTEGSECPRVPQDIEAVARVIGRRNLKNEEGDDRRRLDLRGVRLCHAELGPAADFSSALLTDADLRAAICLTCRFQGADFTSTDMTGARIGLSVLFGAILNNSTLVGAQMEGCRLETAKLRGARLERAVLREAKLNYVDLTDAKLDSADLSGANLQGATLLNTSLSNAVLFGANLLEVKGLTREQLSGAQTDEDTLLPENLR